MLREHWKLDKEVTKIAKNSNGNGRHSLFDPVVVLWRLFSNIWEKEDRQRGINEVKSDSEAVDELEDRLDPPDTNKES